MTPPKSKYRIWDKGILVPAYTRKPKDPRAIALGVRTLEERQIGLKYYIPADAITRAA